jgi:hypothetical protein
MMPASRPEFARIAATSPRSLRPRAAVTRFAAAPVSFFSSVARACGGLPPSLPSAFEAAARRAPGEGRAPSPSPPVANVPTLAVGAP